MDRNQLRALARSSHLTPAELSERNPEVFAAVGAKVVGGEPARLALLPDQPLAEQPLLQGELAAGRLYLLADAAGLPDTAADAVAATRVPPEAIDDGTIAPMVAAGTLAEDQARTLGLAASVYHLVDGDLAVAGALHDLRSPHLPSGRVHSLADLAALDEADWRGLLARAAGHGSTSLDARAAELADRVARLFPTDALLNRLIPAGQDQLATILADGGQRAERLANAFPGLGIAELAGDARLAPAGKAAAIAGRLGAITRLQTQNPEVELLAIDLSEGSNDLAALDTGGIDAEHTARAITALRAHQRMLGLTGDVRHARGLLEAGYRSVFDIRAGSAEDLRANAGISRAAGERYHGDAGAIAATVLGATGSLLDVARGDLNHTDVGNLLPSVQDYVRRLSGYASLFGSQAYCRCEHCASVLSPAAYFVDLMRFVDENITAKVFAGKPDHPLNLKTRRPDLWNLPLTCENTSTEVPVLELVNQILENYLAVGNGFTGDLTDRAAVGEVVYQDLLSQVVGSFRQPFVLPLHRLAVYLARLDSSRDEVAAALGSVAALRTAAALGLSTRQLELITTPDETLAFLRRVYDLPLPVTGAGTVEPFDVQRLVASVGVDREELGRLVSSRFVAAHAPARIVAEKTDADSVQNDIERVHGLTAGSLDRLHRLTRLRRQVPWTVVELDLVLTHVGATVLTVPQLDALAQFLTLQRRLGTTVEETAALTGPIPALSSDGAAPLFDRLFNPAALVARDGRYPKDGTVFIHPALRDQMGAATVDATVHRLQAALGVTDELLLQLIRGLATALGARLGGAESERGFALTLDNLSLLYRHARLARLLRVSAPDLFRLLGHAPGVLATHVGGADDLTALLDLADWWKPSGYTLDDLAVIRRQQPVDRSPYPQPQAVVDEILTDVGEAQALRFADTVFAFLDGVTEDQSRRLVEANKTRIVPTVDGRALRLATDFDLATPLAFPTVGPGDAPITLDQAAARHLLARHHPSQVIPDRLAGKLGLGVEATVALLSLAGANLSSGAIPAALHGEQPPDALVTLVATLIPLCVLLKDRTFDAGAIAFVDDHKPMFAIDVTDVDMAAVRAASRYAAFARAARPSGGDNGGAGPGDPPGYTAAELRHVLSAYTPADRFGNADQAELGRVLGIEPAVLAGVAAAVTLPPGALAALEKLNLAVRLAQRLGVGGPALAGILSDDYPTVQRAADTLLSALRARYPESEWPERVDPVEEAIHSRKRDALTDLLLRSSFPQFTTRADLYQHFLVDVEMEGCARTSRVVAGISSLQLYVHRVLMTLEQDRREPGDPTRVVVPPSLVNADEWAWRKNYRVWEANRKVFLTPEVYLEPGLRDDKTPLFEELEAALLQQPIDEQSALDAYATYLAGFETLASLRIAGTYHDKDVVNRTDLLHLFGVSATDPPTYYYRTGRDVHYGATEPGRATVWSPWRKIDVQISARKVSPVVHRGRLHVFWLDYASKPLNTVQSGNSSFTGYAHTAKVSFTTLRLDGTWTAPQRLDLTDAGPFRGDGVILDLRGPDGKPRYDSQRHDDAKEGYTLRGMRWERVYTMVDGWGQVVAAVGGRLGAPLLVDLYAHRVETGAMWLNFQSGRLLHRRPTATGDGLFATTTALPLQYDTSTKWLDRNRTVAAYPNEPDDRNLDWLNPLLEATPILLLPNQAQLDLVNGSLEDVIIDDQGDLLLLQGSVRPAPRYLLRRIGSTLAADLTRVLFASGVDGLLSCDTQRSLAERPARLAGLNHIDNAVAAGRLDFAGPYGTYLREIFFHIPFLIADHLTSQQQFAAAQRWYHYIFNPTSTGTLMSGTTDVACAVDGDTLHVIRVDADGRAWHLMRAADGAWQASYGDLETHGGEVGSFRSVGCAVEGGRLHVCAVTTDGRLWHTIRSRDGSWQAAFTDVQTLTGAAGRFRVVDCAADGDRLHVCGVTGDGRLLHSVRSADGSWRPGFDDVESHSGDIGTVASVGCAAENGRLHVCGVSANGRLWHTIRFADGSWQATFGDVEAVIGDVGQVTAVACATEGDRLHVCVLSLAGDHMMWHTIRRPGGGWTPAGAPLALLDGAACAVEGSRLHVCGIGWGGGQLYHQERRADGTWVSDGRVEDFARAERDRNWQYLEFRGLDVAKLRRTLTDPAAIAAYRDNPFNPHAIARLRISAYQKAVVMKYVDNLLDWADSLFAQFTTESVNEATMLYSMAQAILGDPPPPLASCDEGAVSPKTYENIAPLLDGDTEFLIELETRLLGSSFPSAIGAPKAKTAIRYALPPVLAAPVGAARTATIPAPISALGVADGAGGGNGRPSPANVPLTPSETAVALAAHVGGSTIADPYRYRRTTKVSWAPERSGTAIAHDGGFGPSRATDAALSLGRALTRSTPVFCIPHNPSLVAYWKRVEDQLYKIRNCQDITGARRLPALLAPQIDPGLLVRARAAGLSLDEVLGATSGDLPPYRFSFLIDRAKAHTATVQAFGSALLSALEKKDLEELNRLRTVQQQNLLKLGTRIRQWEIGAAENALETLNRQRTAAEYRRDYYQGLVDDGLSQWERTQSGFRHAASVLMGLAGTIDVLAGILYLIPQIGSPFSMKYGGQETGSSANAWAMVARDAASVADAVSSSAGLEAGFERRTEGWEHQIELARHDLNVIEKQREAASLRVDIARRAMEVHQESLDQLDELTEYYADKLTGLGLYTKLSTTLQRVHREAYNGAYAMARLAEQAFRLERGGGDAPLLGASYWDAQHAGLLAGERLLVDLQTMERRYLETNYRDLEIDQAFSLSQIDPAALVELREEGSCDFTIPELFFDLFYPGHYRRQIKAVRLTIPCVTGPYTNVSATLSMLASWLRPEPTADLEKVPLRRSTAVAASTAQQDAGVLEVSFRDERYMPFEKSGAVSIWRLSLPRTFRPFDYRTITDVILHVTYTAQADEQLRQTVEERNAGVEGSLRTYLTEHPLVRVFSLRSDFSGVFDRLLHSLPGTAVRFRFGREQLPLFLPGPELLGQGKDLRAQSAKLCLVPAEGASAESVGLLLDTATLSDFDTDLGPAGLPSADAADALVPSFLGDHTLTIVDGGDLAPETSDSGDVSALDPDKIHDMLIVITYKLPE